MRDKEEFDFNQAQVSLAIFLEFYNKNIPMGFSRASVATLTKFRDTHPTLFKHGDMWSVAQHRKRVIDWFCGQGNIA